MKLGYLNEFFGPVGWKRLVQVEVDPKKSNQHEFNGSKAFIDVLGTTERRIRKGTGIPARALYFSDELDNPREERFELSWYDSRRKGIYPNARQKKRSPEFRLFYQKNSLIGKSGTAAEGDLLIIAFNKELTNVTVIVAKSGSIFENQLLWLFGIDANVGNNFEVHSSTRPAALDLSATRIVEAIGIAVQPRDEALLDRMLRKFGNDLPSAEKFSTFARSSVRDADPIEDPDRTVVRWMEQEELAFRVFEKHLVEKRLSQGFSGVDDFVSYSLSVQNRRKSRAGSGFENHLRELFSAHKLRFSWKPEVENKAKPDFVFPGVVQYKNTLFPESLLTILGAKTTCKDRWRQVLAESQRGGRHLVTLEPGISSTQLAEMRANRLQLVVPSSIQPTYKASDRGSLWSLSQFIKCVAEKQNSFV